MNNNPNGGRFMPMQLGSIDNSPHDIREYWTPERKKAATPVIGGAPISQGRPSADNAPPPPPPTDPKEANLAEMPFTTGGKLFYSMNGKDFVASGNIFMKNNMLLTAAHCIQDKDSGSIGENYVFELDYTGELSSEDFTFKTVALRENWYQTKNEKYDYAIAILDKPSKVATPMRYTTDTQIRDKQITSMGYPTAYFDGAQMMFVKGLVVPIYGHWAMFGSKMGAGASGGAWVLDDNVTAVGLNAYVSVSGKEILYSGSPLFDKEFDSLYQYALTLM